MGFPSPDSKRCDATGPPRATAVAAFTATTPYGALIAAFAQRHSIWRLRANSSSRRDRAPGRQHTRSAPRTIVVPGFPSGTVFPISIPANSDTPRQKAECASNVCMSITPSCPCAANGPILTSFHTACTCYRMPKNSRSGMKTACKATRRNSLRLGPAVACGHHGDVSGFTARIALRPAANA